MNTPLGRVSRISLLLVALVVALIGAGLLVPGGTGATIEAVGWAVLGVGIVLEVGVRTTPLLGRHDEGSRRHSGRS